MVFSQFSILKQGNYFQNNLSFLLIPTKIGSFSYEICIHFVKSELYQSGQDKMAFHHPLFNNYFIRIAKKVEYGNACCLILGV